MTEGEQLPATVKAYTDALTSHLTNREGYPETEASEIINENIDVVTTWFEAQTPVRDAARRLVERSLVQDGAVTFEEFQRSRQWVSGIPDDFGGADDGRTMAGYCYCGTAEIARRENSVDGALFIAYLENGAGDVPPQHYHLIIERSEFVEPDLDELEWHLYTFAARERLAARPYADSAPSPG